MSEDSKIFFNEGLWTPRPGHSGFRSWNDAEVALPFVYGSRCAIQAGGYLGMWPLTLARHFKRVVTFEPYNLNFLCLEKNIGGRTDRIVAHHAALGEKAGTCSTDVDIKNSSRTQIITLDGPVQMMSIDGLARDDVDFICLDMESYEFLALKGAWHTIQRCRPTIMVECSGPAPRDGRKHNYADIALMLEGYEQKARIGRDVVLQWTGTKKRLAYLGKPPTVPSEPQYRGPHVD